MAARNEVAIDVTARNMATRELDAASNALMQMGSAVEKSGFLATSASQVWMGAMMRIGDAVTNFFAKGMAIVSDSIIGFNARQEQALIGFTTMLGSAQKAQGFMEELQDFAAATPFEFDGLRQSANLIMAMGFEAKEVIPLLTAAGDAVAALGLGTEAVQRVVYALGQMKAAGRVTGQDMMQLASMGIPAWKMLADAVGMTVQEAKKAAEQGLIDADTAIKGITEAIETGNMGGMMAAQARTFNGAMSTIKDTVQIVVASAFKPLFDELSGLALAVADFLGSADFLAWADDVGQGLGDIISQFMELGDAIVPIAMSILPALFDIAGSVVDVFLRGLDLILGSVGLLVEGLGAIAPILTTILPTLINIAVAWKGATLAVAAYVAVQKIMAGDLVIGAMLRMTQIVTSLIGLFRGATGAAAALGTAVGFASGGLSLIIPLIAAVIGIAMQFIDVGKVIDNFAMDFGEMGETVHAVADSTGRDYDSVKGAISELREEFEYSFEEAAEIVTRFGDDAEDMGDDVKTVMDGLGVSVSDSIGIINDLGEGWRTESREIIEAVAETGVSWDQAYDHLYTLNAGMIDSEEITRRLSEAAMDSPEAWAALVAGVEPADEAFLKLQEEMDKTTEAIRTSGIDWILGVEQGVDGIVVTLEGGTTVVGESADQVMGQISQIAEQRMAEATAEVDGMISDITTLFDSEEEAVEAAKEFWEKIQDPFKDTDQIAFVINELTNEKIPAAFTTGSTKATAEAAQYVEDMLGRFDAIHPGMLQAGEDGGTGLFEGMEPSLDEILVWATDTFAPQLAEGMTMQEAMRDAGFDNMADYIDGIEAQELEATRSAQALARSGVTGIHQIDFEPSGRSSATEFNTGVNNPATRTGANSAGAAIGRESTSGAKAGSSGMWQGGNSAGIAWANGLRDAKGYANLMAWELAAAADPALHGLSPPKEGPLSDIDVGGFNIGKAWADGLKRATPYVRGAAEDIAGAASLGLRGSPGTAVAGMMRSSAYGGYADEVFGAGVAPGVTIVNHFGAGSVRSDDDIYAISKGIALQVRMETV